MHLVELIAAPQTDAALLDALETFLTTTLGKGVIRAKDTPNFIANRIGIFSMLATMRHTQTFGLSFDVVDALTGPGDRPREERDLPHRGRRRPRHDGARRQDDARHAARRSVARALRDAAGAGRRWSRRARSARRRRRASSARSARTSRCSTPRRATTGPRRARSRRKWRSCSRSGRPPRSSRSCAPARIRRRSSCGRSSATSSTTARITWPSIADNARDVDLAIRWGFGWQMGPFETWQAAGWKRRRRVGSPRTSPPARRWPTCRCRRG